MIIEAPGLDTLSTYRQKSTCTRIQSLIRFLARKKKCQEGRKPVIEVLGTSTALFSILELVKIEHLYTHITG